MSKRQPGKKARLAKALLVLLVLAGPLRAQDDRAPVASYLESLGVRLVNVEVLATDKSGATVTDLRAEDFELREDGKKVRITHFRPPRAVAGSERIEPAADGHVVLLVDNLAIELHSRRRVLAGAREFIERSSGSGLQFAVASYDGYLRVRQTFTRDVDLLRRALEELEKPNPLGLARRAEGLRMLRDSLEELRRIQTSAPDPARDPVSRITTLTRQIESYAEQVRHDTQATLYSVSHLVNALAALPGRKTLVYVSEGMPMRPGEELFAAVQQASRDTPTLEGGSGFDRRQASINSRSAALGALSSSAPRTVKGGKLDRRGLQQLTAMANAGQVSIYTLRSRGNPGGVPVEVAGDLSRLYTPQMMSIRDQNLAETLQVMGGETGGDSWTGTDIEGLLGKAVGELEAHYSLAYEPPHPADGEFHAIKLKVKRKGLQLRYRAGYLDKPLAAKLADRATTSLMLGIDDNPHGVTIELGSVDAVGKKGVVQVRLIVGIPLGGLLLTERDGVYGVDTQLFVAARDELGDVAPVQALGLRIETDTSLADDPEQVFRGQLPLTLKREAQRVAVAFVDPLTGSASFVSTDLELPAAPGS